MMKHETKARFYWKLYTLWHSPQGNYLRAKDDIDIIDSLPEDRILGTYTRMLWAWFRCYCTPHCIPPLPLGSEPEHWLVDKYRRRVVKICAWITTRARYWEDQSMVVKDTKMLYDTVEELQAKVKRLELMMMKLQKAKS